MYIFISCLVTLANAGPLLGRTVWDPPITSPDASTVWTVGSKETVKWDISSKPQVVSSFSGTLVLGFLDNTEGEHLMLDSPLAQGFNLTDATVDIVVPNLPARNDYIVVLMGDSGNASPKFTIANSSIENPASSSSSSLTTPTAPPSIQHTPTTAGGADTTANSLGLSASTPSASSSSSSTSTSSSSGTAAAAQTQGPTSSSLPRHICQTQYILLAPVFALFLFML
ncbi:hypothetical protein BD410DRAFT_776335 [Rickenella mellea]|uniref:Ser-Thr-rich glycosyl-phosphatidyl-inositol-anchored membrane family-domain-containing protein n=1 Tax=Rickenella mellea TaxID=50990 RepID=A0A4Y7PQS0_9AGAM|nr:hypothetical protein BD410DRAFT_776335 [Rickenella mellea]